MPDLRFRIGTENYPDWTVSSLNDLYNNSIIEMGRGKVISKIDIQRNQGDYPIYSSSSLNNGLFGKQNNYMFDDERITWSVDGGGKFFYRPPHKYSVTNVCGWIKVSDATLSTQFLFHQLSRKWSNKHYDYSNKAHPSVIRREYTVSIPSLPEQEKIAGFLGALDERIRVQEEIIEKLKDQKQGYLQKIFNQELRFRDEQGNQYPEWETKKLGEVAEKIKARNKDLSNCNVFTNSAIYGIISQRDFFEKDIAVKGNTGNYYILENGDWCYNPRISSNAPCGPISMNKTKNAGIVSPLYKAFRTFDVISNGYLECYFDSNQWNHYIQLNGNSGAREDRYSLSDKVFFDMNIPVPCNEEQIKIYDLFKKMNIKLKLELSVLKSLKLQKQSYMQKIF